MYQAAKMIYLLKSKYGGTTASAESLAKAKAMTRDGTFSIAAYGFGKGSTTARKAVRIGRDILCLRLVKVDGCRTVSSDPADVKTALDFINAEDVLILCEVSRLNPDETSWDLSRTNGSAYKIQFVSKSMPEIKAAMKASREKAEIAKATLNPAVVGGNRRRGTLL